MRALFKFFVAALFVGAVGTAVSLLLIAVFGAPAPQPGTPTDALSGMPCGPGAGMLRNAAVFFQGMVVTSLLVLAGILLLILPQVSPQFRQASQSELGQQFAGEAVEGLGSAVGIAFAAVVCGLGGLLSNSNCSVPANRPIETTMSASQAPCSERIRQAEKQFGRNWVSTCGDCELVRTCARELQKRERGPQPDRAPLLRDRDEPTNRTVRQPHTDTYCLNQVSLARSRASYGDDWKSYMSDADRVRCLGEAVSVPTRCITFNGQQICD